jgi:phosphoenolpyruvate carboxykinase (GTP)
VAAFPTPESLDVSGLDMTPEQVEQVLRVDPQELDGLKAGHGGRG